MRTAGILAATILLFASLLGGVAAQGGGTVQNKAPSITSFDTSATSLGAGQSAVLVGTLHDSNGEADLVEIRVLTESGPALILERDLVAADVSQTTEPASFTDGWKVWNPTSDDGDLQFAVTIPHTQAGSYVWRASVADEASPILSAGTLTVSVSGGGGGGGGGAPQTSVPAPTDSPPSNPSSSVDSDGDGASDAAELLLVTAPHDATQRPSFDITDRLSARRQGNDTVLEWPGIPQALGYVVWRGTSPFLHLASLVAESRDFVDVDAPLEAKYKLTFYTHVDALSGFTENATRAGSLPGWDAAVFRAASRGEELQGPSAGNPSENLFASLWPMGLLVIVVSTVVASWRLRRVLQRPARNPTTSSDALADALEASDNAVPPATVTELKEAVAAGSTGSAPQEVNPVIAHLARLMETNRQVTATDLQEAQSQSPMREREVSIRRDVADPLPLDLPDAFLQAFAPDLIAPIEPEPTHEPLDAALGEEVRLATNKLARDIDASWENIEIVKDSRKRTPPSSDGASSARPHDDEPGLTWGDLNAEMNLTAAWVPREKKTPRADGDGDPPAPIVLGLLLAFLLSATAQVLRLFG